MARKADKGSNRQLAFKYLDDHTGKPRAELLDELMVELSIGLVYAKTLYQAWRKIGKEAGTLIAVYEVRDHKDGVTVDPYMFIRHVSDPTAGTVTSMAWAIKQYVRDLQDRTKKAKKL